MALTAVKKIGLSASSKSTREAGALLDSIPPYREPVTLEELERRADEVESGKVKPISSAKFAAHIERLRKSIR